VTRADASTGPAEAREVDGLDSVVLAHPVLNETRVAVRRRRGRKLYFLVAIAGRDVKIA
jgi:hypothetical protein